MTDAKASNCAAKSGSLVSKALGEMSVPSKTPASTKMPARKRTPAPPIRRAFYLRFLAALMPWVFARICNVFGSDGFDALCYTLGGGAYSLGNAEALSFGLFLAGIPHLVFCYLFADFLEESFACAGPYVFTRLESRNVWTLLRLMQLAGFTCAYVFLAGVVLLAPLSGEAHLSLAQLAAAQGWSGCVTLLGSMFLLNVLSLLAALFLINVLALRGDALVCFVCVMASIYLCLIAFPAAPLDAASAAIVWLPTTQGVYFWHELPPEQAFLGSRGIAGFTLARSYAYLLAILAAEGLLATLFAKHLELR